MDLVICFTDKSISFTNGYEAGVMARRMELSEPSIDCGYEEGFPLHEENIELYQAMADYYGYDMYINSDCEGWAAVMFKKKVSRPHLRLVK